MATEPKRTAAKLRSMADHLESGGPYQWGMTETVGVMMVPSEGDMKAVQNGWRRLTIDLYDPAVYQQCRERLAKGGTDMTQVEDKGRASLDRPEQPINGEASELLEQLEETVERLKGVM